ncbi:hypothetical protein NQ176_g5182 [Zarea fungicola]|uniref:Uncharacterized protein n=1 Tax=Zarea fungicola TaxID=93591 RepID=A0ACC1N9U4_9HYPO|nr:hypothetical protein NQ176_g5182 [Lecanicillium fungicola]
MAPGRRSGRAAAKRAAAALESTPRGFADVEDEPMPDADLTEMTELANQDDENDKDHEEPQEEPEDEDNEENEDNEGAAGEDEVKDAEPSDKEPTPPPSPLPDTWIRLGARETAVFHIWDNAGAQLIFTELGGKITDFDGKVIDFGAGRALHANKGMIAARASVHETIFKKANEILAAEIALAEAK